MKKVLNHIIICVIYPIIGLLLLFFVHLLPTDKIGQHIYESLPMIESEFNDEVVIDGYRSTLTGSFTDCLMLEHAAYSNPLHSPLEQSLLMYRGETSKNEEGWEPGYSLAAYLNGNELAKEVSYSRYWHGYLVLLKPLLLLTNVSTIRLINSTVLLCLLGIAIILLAQSTKNENKIMPIVSFTFSIPFLFFSTSFMSLSLSICLYIMLIACIGVMLLQDRLSEKKLYPVFFLTIGAFTAYNDFLTYPLVTLVFPLVITIFLINETTYGNRIKNIIVFSFEWGLGYFSMWGAKWVLADLLVDTNTIHDALSTLSARTSSAEGIGRLGGFFKVLKLNALPYANWGYLIIILCVLLIFLVTMTKNKSFPAYSTFVDNSFLPIIALIPLAWYFLTQNHSEEHWVFTCRNFSCIVFPVLAYWESVVKNKITTRE